MNTAKIEITEKEECILTVNGEPIDRLFSLSVETILDFDINDDNNSIKTKKTKLSYTNLDSNSDLEHRSFYVDVLEHTI